MKAFNPDVVSRKLLYINERMNRLQRFREITVEGYLDNPDYQDIVERNLAVLIQAAADVNRYVLTRLATLSTGELGQITNADSFLLMAQAGGLPETLAEQLAESGRFRNVLAHLYDEILPEKVIEALRLALQYYPDYIYVIQSYLDSLQDEPC